MKVKLDVESIPQIKQSRGLEERGRVQRMIDSEVIRLMSPYTPRDTGALINSATRLTQIGSGLVRQGGPSAQCHLVKNISFVKKAINYDSLFCVMRYVSHYISSYA